MFYFCAFSYLHLLQLSHKNHDHAVLVQNGRGLPQNHVLPPLLRPDCSIWVETCVLFKEKRKIMKILITLCKIEKNTIKNKIKFKQLNCVCTETAFTKLCIYVLIMKKSFKNNLQSIYK